MVRLVHPAPAGNATDPPRRRRGIQAPSLSLTADEARCLRASIRNIVRLNYGTVAALAADLQVDRHVLTHKRAPSPGLAVAIWRLTRIPVESLLSGKLAAVPAPAPAPGQPKGGAS